jgi:hypothetical protein
LLKKRGTVFPFKSEHKLSEDVYNSNFEEKERKEEKDHVMAAAVNVAAAEIQRAYQLIYDQIAALETFMGDSDVWYD